ncbi:hypothetical protein D3C71_1890000 [compost metagenome]
MVHIAYAAVDKPDDQFHCGLQLTRYAAGGVFGNPAENHQEQNPEDNGEKHRVEVNRPKTSPDLKLRQVVTDILLWTVVSLCRHDASTLI